jgi:hypothetical protein
MYATQPPINDLAALDAAISGFDRVDLLSAVAGLQLLPKNAERVVRLEALAHRIACLTLYCGIDLSCSSLEMARQSLSV